ncbi:hypothetical protein [Brunnivagina elsteri]|uniref:Uncharacterized protein n=1 Tax=Brunnivagina elsteri CCALA 953 TaxID=987040 RepID=A0A2A2TGJ7_9CYAN|nr:hypothetical protein [Calothrix elsteri]PAX52549.1 hypothetical protein CK510_18765 [Calothrix elsteri CCALA 953]
MRIWFVCFLLLFVLAELFDWVKDFTLPLPIYILGGAFLAVVSNYDKLIGSYLNQSSNMIRDIIPEQAQLNLSAQTNQEVTFTNSQPAESVLLQSDNQDNK